VLGAGAGAERRRAKPVGPAGEVSCDSRVGRSTNDASSEARRPVMEGVWAHLWCLAWGWHGYAHELEVYGWVGLEVWCHDLCVLAQVELECVAFPPAHGLYDVEGYASEKVFEGASDAEAVAFEVGEVVGGCDGSHPFDEFALGERGAGFFAVCFVGEDMRLGEGR
jgi:hypothetical protein